MARYRRFLRIHIWWILALVALYPVPVPAGSINQVTVVSGQARHSFRIELAVTPEARQKGLMHRRQMPANAGMLFIFPEPARHGFWMKNTLIPLDMLFATADGRIVHVHHNAQPHSLASIMPDVASVAVLEINGGLSRRLGIGVGDRILHPSLAKTR